VGTAAAFITPRGITTDGTNLYVADYGNNTIRKIVIDSAEVSPFAGTDGAVFGYADGTGNEASFHSPSGITYHNGFLYVSDTVNNRIRKIEVSTKIVTTLSGLANVDGPVNAGFADGTADSAKFYLPQGITTDGTYVYVADTANHRIRRIDIANGTTDTIAGTGLAGSADGSGDVATFNLPTGITSDGTYLYVAEFGSHIIRKITVGDTAALSTVALLAGSAGTAGAVGGAGTVARFNGPSGITTDGTNLYVSDYSGYTIRKIQ
jgi:sugar lactone lactonase YvrE